MDEVLEKLVAELTGRAPEMRERAECVLDEQMEAYKELLGLSDEGATFLKEKVYFRLASENVPSLLEDLEEHLGSEGLDELLHNPEPLDAIPELRLQGNYIGSLLIEDYDDFFTQSFTYLQPDTLDPQGGIIIGLIGEDCNDEYFRWGVAAELAHHLVYFLRLENEVHGGIDEFYDCALSTPAVPADIKEKRLSDSAFNLRMYHLAATHFEKASDTKDAAGMAADSWIEERKKNYASREKPSIRDRLGNFITQTPVFRWYMQSLLYSYFTDVEGTINPEHLQAFSLTWQVLEEIQTLTGYSFEESYELLPKAAAGALLDPDVNHFVMGEFINDVKAKLPKYLGLQNG